MSDHENQNTSGEQIATSHEPTPAAETITEASASDVSNIPVAPSADAEVAAPVAAALQPAAHETVVATEVAPQQELEPSVSPSVSSAPMIVAPRDPRPLRAAALQRRRAHRNERLEKIIIHAREKGSITNRDVALVLHVASATATRYLNELVKGGRLNREGKRRGARYRAALPPHP